MHTITWAPELATGFAEMDELHRGMIEAMRQLHDTEDHHFARVYREFVESAEEDFRAEEAAMDLVRYADARVHCEEHARALSALHHTMSKIMQGDIASGRQAISLLFQWFTVHIETMDSGLALACRTH